MDPSVCLAELREKAQTLLDDTRVRSPQWIETALDLAQQITALDHWLSTGGFLPHDWQLARDRADGLAP